MAHRSDLFVLLPGNLAPKLRRGREVGGAFGCLVSGDAVGTLAEQAG